MTSFDAKLRQNATDIERALGTLLNADRLAGPGEPPGRLVAAMRHGALEGRQAAAAVPAARDGAYVRNGGGKEPRFRAFLWNWCIVIR